LYARTGQFDRAEKRLTEALTIRRGALGEQHPDVAETVFDLSTVAEARGDLETAMKRKREALALRQRIDAAGERDPNLAYSYFDLARLLRKTGDDVEAETQCRKALAIERTHPSPLPIALKLNLLATILIDKGEPAEAEPLLRESIKLRRSVMPEDHWTIADDRAALGRALALQGRYADAEPLWLDAFQALKDKFGRQHRRTQAVVRYLVDMYEAEGRDDDAATWRQRVDDG
jgi:tetratricopeptide (TPR) repeat protein